MGIFNNLTSSGLEESQDRLGGFSLYDSGIYQAKIKLAYVTKSQKGALQVSFIFDIDGKEYREGFYVSNRNGQNYSVNAKGKKIPLPGFTIVDDICLIASGKPLAEQDSAEKVVKIYNFEAKAEVPTNVPVMVDLLDKPVALAILKRLVNKQVKQGDTYVDSAETREVNTVDKVFHPELKLTVAEARHNKSAEFWNKWEEKNKGIVQDRTKKVNATSSMGTFGSTTQAQPQKSLFG